MYSRTCSFKKIILNRTPRTIPAGRNNAGRIMICIQVGMGILMGIMMTMEIGSVTLERTIRVSGDTGLAGGMLPLWGLMM
jgi:hypothetical protein